ncbi:MAG: aldo/keto reductase [Actinomycetota bacterium]|nr:aldo/keto reductase [Actinomycetota bacterium]
MGLSLGTAQWGAGYGLTNAVGFLDDQVIGEITEAALGLGIRSVDTHRTSNPAQGYGAAQTRLKPWAREFSVTTKVIAGPSADLPIRAQLEASLLELGLDSVASVLIHDWAAIDELEATAAVHELHALKEAGLISRIGISAYDEDDVVRAQQHFASLDVVQVPISVLDQRLVVGSRIADLHFAGAQIQVRSVFLQGLLLAPDHDSPLARHPHVQGFHRWCARAGLTPLQAALGFIQQIPWADEVVVGVTSAAELLEIDQAWQVDAGAQQWGELSSDDTDLIDPRRWNR